MQRLELIAVVVLLLIAAVYAFYQVLPNLSPQVDILRAK